MRNCTAVLVFFPTVGLSTSGSKGIISAPCFGTPLKFSANIAINFANFLPLCFK